MGSQTGKPKTARGNPVANHFSQYNTPALIQRRAQQPVGVINTELATFAGIYAVCYSVPSLGGHDQFEDWFRAGAADGYNLMFPLLPEDWLNFTSQVVPELQRRGVFRREYEPGTFRDRLGLQRPPNRFSAESDGKRAAS